MGAGRRQRRPPVRSRPICFSSASSRSATPAERTVGSSGPPALLTQAYAGRHAPAAGHRTPECASSGGFETRILLVADGWAKQPGAPLTTASWSAELSDGRSGFMPRGAGCAAARRGGAREEAGSWRRKSWSREDCRRASRSVLCRSTPNCPARTEGDHRRQQDSELLPPDSQAALGVLAGRAATVTSVPPLHEGAAPWHHFVPSS
jgi:hypothetical protein